MNKLVFVESIKEGLRVPINAEHIDYIDQLAANKGKEEGIIIGAALIVFSSGRGLPVKGNPKEVGIDINNQLARSLS